MNLLNLLMLIALSLLTFGLNSAFGEGAQSLPPPLPPYAPGHVVTTPDAKPVADAAQEKVDCKPEEKVYGKIVCDCGSAKTKTKTIIKTVEKPVIKIVEKIKYVTKYVDRYVDRPVDRPVVTDRVVEKSVIKEVPAASQSSHTFGILLGNGPDGVDLRLYGGEYQFMQKYGWVGGPMYQYKFASGFGLGAAYLTSDTWLGTGTYTFSIK